MNIPFKKVSILGLFFTLFCAASYATQLIEWEDLSAPPKSKTSATALTFADNWKHTESSHFIYHFITEKTAESITTYAEIYYDWIKDLFGITNDAWDTKVQVFVFEEEPKWREFVAKTGGLLEGQAFTDGEELFIYRTPFWLSPRQTLAHEMTHVLVYRFIKGRLPLFLNEGFAEYVSYKTLATHFGGNQYELRTANKIAASDYIPLKTLTTLNAYPKENIKNFYKESELLVRFLVEKGNGKDFYRFLQMIAGNGDFSRTLEEVYGLDLDRLEEEFKTFIA